MRGAKQSGRTTYRAQDLIRICRRSPNYSHERYSGDHLIITARNGRIVIFRTGTTGGAIPNGTAGKIRRQMIHAGFLMEGA